MGIDAVLAVLRCPHCAGPLSRAGAAVGCADGHRFDPARQGHLNLLGSAPPANADNAEMVAARLRFLDAGHYRPILDAVAEAIPPGAERWIEPGCGPGWYLSRLLDGHPRAVALAADVSVAAVRRAARAHERIGAVVFDTWRSWPVSDAAADLVLVIFAPRNPAEFARVLRPGGTLITVTPNPDHLAELRAGHGLLDVPEDKSDRLSEALSGDFEAAGNALVRADLALTADEVADLIAMGPNAFHRRPDAHVAAADTLSVTVGRWVRK